MVDKLSAKLQGWKAKLLSQEGRTTLISSVLQAILLYTFACFRVPETICNRMDAVTRAFWWGHDQGVMKLHLIHWKMCASQKEKGVLSLKGLAL